jgi:3-methyladenine DNA glycosylase Tag
MQGQATENNIYRLERQFEYQDSITIVRKQVEKYERLVKEQAEKVERARQNADEAEKLQRKVESFRKGK